MAGQVVPGGCKDEPSFEIDFVVARPGGIRIGGLPDDIVADQQSPLGSAVAVVRLAIVRIVRVAGIVGRFAEFQPVVRQFRRSAIAVPAPGVQRVKREPVAIPASGFEQLRRQPIAVALGWVGLAWQHLTDPAAVR